MLRRTLAIFTALFLAVPPGAYPSDAAAETGRPGWMGGPFFWGALTLLNATILTSSIGDLGFYESRADEISGEGGDADAYWDAASREKLTIGIAGLSLLFSLAGLKGSLSSPEPPPTEPLHAPAAELPTPPGPVPVLALESRVRYDTLFTAAADADSIARRPGGVVLSAPADSALQEPAAPPATEPTAPGIPADTLGGILATLGEPAPSVPAEAESSGAGVPAAKPAEPAAAEPAKPPVAGSAARAEEEEPTFTLLPYGVHVTSFKTQALAEKGEAIWLKRGETVTIEEDEVEGKGIWFRVLIGNFRTAEEAKAYAEAVRSKYGLDYAQPQRRAGF
ncbi:MAG: hypothetical protein EHM19_04015 [Candidatus Latescibacterota bacterium]|nr:MAG: hypothetical protein EHM19_04015 [Candidatus Latescibacterota bacterium]